MSASDTAGSAGALSLALPAPVLVWLPVGHLVAAGLGLAPARTRGRYRVRVAAVEDEHDAPIARRVRRHLGAFEEKAHACAVWIVGLDGEQDRLLLGLRFVDGAVRQETIIGEGPQLRVERLDALLGGRLHDHPPAALERFLKQRRQDFLQRLAFEVVEEDFRHLAHSIPFTSKLNTAFRPAWFLQW